MGAAFGFRDADCAIEASTVEDQISHAGALMARSWGSIVAFTGAGVSAESGVPTYRDQGGLWTVYDQKKVSHIAGFLRNPLACWRFELELFRLLRSCHFNPGHGALAELERLGALQGVITQNVDGMHQAAGNSTVFELHGNETRAVCMNEDCRKSVPFTSIFEGLRWIDARGNINEAALPDDAWIRIGDDDSDFDEDMMPSEMALEMSGAHKGAPRCSACGCLMKPDAIYFGESLDQKLLLRAERLANKAKCMLVIGSNCSVAPANTLPSMVKRQNGVLIEINPRESRISDIADVRLSGRAGDILPRLVSAMQAHRQTL